MNLYEKLERKFGNLAVPKLNLYLVIMFLMGLIINMLMPSFYYEFLSMDINAILHGQIWRIITFLFYPISSSSFLLLSLLIVYVYYQLATILESVWGDFKFTLYIFIGILGHFLGGLLVYLISGANVILKPTYLVFSIYIAFALTFPDVKFLIYFIIPVKAKYIAIFELVFFLIQLIIVPFQDKIAIVCSLLNVFIFLYVSYKSYLISFINKLKYKFKSH